ncbi:lysophospholipid acyltransferase family protein [Lachnoclostridium phytofermentans]|uniref:1-acyl-sn-glycerol-3-phosphate acyltransferase n=1 Tax=Lachnoclostridium phytofermentans (strain ATCC 700394 / DSM 18823 / ISDg) TaxID=357809 RepID=A9KKE3_LACP7|nr:lysophospholipid acyltransferase family protein [Lachnoclostridium phytofermentans]ABX44134.1 1-acyl-sn-glycerol-3-phosphate acyltransferase [Lachnoclostridium phytofermentans ISDg]
MRTVLVILAITIFLIISLPFYLISLIIGLFNNRAKIRFSQTAAKVFFRIILIFSATKVKVLGRENVPSKEAVLYTANHRGLADIAVAYVTLPTLTGFVAKKEMGKIPVMSWWMRNLNCLFLDRENPREGLKTILTGVENIRKGYSMFIMPEGTRNHEEEMLPFKEGSFKMAEKTGCAIIPVAITNSDAVFERQFPWVKKATVVIHYGNPIYPNDLPKEERKFIGNHVRDVISSMLEEDKKLAL